MTMDPAFQTWRGEKLQETNVPGTEPYMSFWLAQRVDKIAAEILTPARLVAQPNRAALGLGSADEAAGRN